VEPRISIITLGVRDLDRSYRFYYSGYFSDPDGYLWEVAWAKDWEFNPDGSLVIR
jgi:predicted lactoylglutathione lyase